MEQRLRMHIWATESNAGLQRLSAFTRSCNYSISRMCSNKLRTWLHVSSHRLKVLPSFSQIHLIANWNTHATARARAPDHTYIHTRIWTPTHIHFGLTSCSWRIKESQQLNTSCQLGSANSRWRMFHSTFTRSHFALFLRLLTCIPMSDRRRYLIHVTISYTSV